MTKEDLTDLIRVYDAILSLKAALGLGDLGGITRLRNMMLRIGFSSPSNAIAVFGK